MNKKQKEILMKKFKEQQKLNLELFQQELKVVGDSMDYIEEQYKLDLAIHNSKRDLKLIKEMDTNE